MAHPAHPLGPPLAWITFDDLSNLTNLWGAGAMVLTDVHHKEILLFGNGVELALVERHVFAHLTLIIRTYCTRQGPWLAH